MRPILATIPALPSAFLWPLIGVAALLGGVFAAREAKNHRTGRVEGDLLSAIAMPLVIAACAAFMFVMWSRNPIKLHSYGLFLILGFAAATFGACLEAKRRGYDPNLLVDLALPLLGASIFACRILYVLLNRSQFSSFGEIFRVWDGGLSFHGSLVAAPLVVWFYAARNKMSFGQLADVIAPSVFLGYAIGRLGCFFNGCCYGAVCDLPWAMQFPDENQRSILTPDSHPTQLYSTIIAIGLFFLMQSLKRKPQFTRFAGQLTLIFFAMYAVERAFIEYFRNGATARTVLGTNWLTQAQVASGLALLVLAALYVYLSRRAAQPTTPATGLPTT
ncbi:MAG TPA: prolipoprotein diacylglyceryl transferase [Abditibacteriaceae bacterium]|jgi:phosphatidylglycerol:prolipoprotein diacylglycerol transferase